VSDTLSNIDECEELLLEHLRKSRFTLSSQERFEWFKPARGNKGHGIVSLATRFIKKIEEKQYGKDLS